MCRDTGMGVLAWHPSVDLYPYASAAQASYVPPPTYLATDLSPSET